MTHAAKLSAMANKTIFLAGVGYLSANDVALGRSE